MYIGILVIFTGLIFLLQNLHIIGGDIPGWSIIWPVGLIVIGMHLLHKHMGKRCICNGKAHVCCEHCTHKNT